MSRPRRIFERSRAALAAFLETESSGGVVLLVATVAALLWANLFGGYDEFWTSSRRHFVDDWLMVLFFFVVGLEIKRELVVGELRNRRVAAMPIVAAIGGIAGPALIYIALNAGGPGARGWAIPMATDIAFVVGAMALLGPRAPDGLKLFVLTLAIVDDIAAIAVIAFAYLGFGGLHPTLGGVALALFVPARPIRGRAVLDTLERRLHPVSSYVVIPIFALANAGVVIDAATVRTASSSTIFWGIVAGLVGGKTIGIFGTARLAQSIGFGRRPAGVRWGHLAGGAVLSGIGFTVALFIAELAFDTPELVGVAKLGVLTGSVVAAVLGTLGLTLVHPRRQLG